MKKLILTAIIALTAIACDYDDASIREDIADLQDRVAVLEELVSQMENNIGSLQTLVSAAQSGDWVTSVTETESGYIVTFYYYGTITITNGTDGTDGYTPNISVTLIDGVWYWTLDGDLLTDGDGNPIAASPTDGSMGATPLLKIEEGGWYYSIDGGITWSYLSELDWGAGVSPLFSGVEQDDDNVYFYLSDGTVITVPKGSEFGITLSSVALLVAAGQSVVVEYSLTGADSSTLIRTYAQGGYSALLEQADSTGGTITITAPDEYADSTDIWVFMSNDERMVVATISVNASQTPIFNVTSIENFTYEGGSATFSIQSYIASSSSSTASPWMIEFVEGDEDTGYTVVQQPSWLTISALAGDGSSGGESVTVTIDAQELCDMNDHDAVLQAAATVVDYDLSTKGGSTLANTANCYIVGAAGSYTLPLVYGNAIKNGSSNTNSYTSSVTGDNILTVFVNHLDAAITDPYIYNNEGCTPSDAVVVWQDVNGLVDNVSLSEDKHDLCFTIPQSTIAQGNAILAVRDSEENVLWSWHIWVTDYVPELDTDMEDQRRDKIVTNYQGVQYSMMPVNIGWCYTEEYGYPSRETSIRVTQTETGGYFIIPVYQQAEFSIPKGNSTYYQWGRKDPLLAGVLNSSGNTVAKSYYTSISSLAPKNSGTMVSIGTTVLHPNVFYESYDGDSSTLRWIENTYYNLWNINNEVYTFNDNTVEKTIYDPSPVGYCVPPTNFFTGMTSTGQSAISLLASIWGKKVNSPCDSEEELEDNQGLWIYCNPMPSEGVFDTTGGRFFLTLSGYYADGTTTTTLGVVDVGILGNYWSAGPASGTKYYSAGDYCCCGCVGGTVVSPTGGFAQRLGYSVRCVRED